MSDDLERSRDARHGRFRSNGGHGPARVIRLPLGRAGREEAREDTPAIWRMILRTDEMLRIAEAERDTTALDEARELLWLAGVASEHLPDPRAREALAAQIRLRRFEFERLKRAMP